MTGAANAPVALLIMLGFAGLVAVIAAFSLAVGTYIADKLNRRDAKRARTIGARAPHPTVWLEEFTVGPDDWDAARDDRLAQEIREWGVPA